MGGWPVGYLHNAVEELNSGLPRTNPDSSRAEDLNQGPPDFKSSALNHSAMLPPWTCLFTKFVSFAVYKCSRPHFLKVPQTFWARKTIFNSSVSENREVYVPKTSCLNWASVHIKNMWVKQLSNHKVGDFCFGFPGPKSIWAFEKRTLDMCINYHFTL